MERSLACCFSIPSLRTRISFEVAMQKLGGNALALSPGWNTWNFEVNLGEIMNGKNAEHVKEAAQVISRYVDAIGVRSFAQMKSLAEDETDQMMNVFREHATVPVVNMESATEHPCQALADMMTVKEKVGDAKGKKFVLRWAPHVKPLPFAVPNSAVLAAAYMGMDITVARPDGYDLSENFIGKVKEVCSRTGASYTTTSEMSDPCADAEGGLCKELG